MMGGGRSREYFFRKMGHVRTSFGVCFAQHSQVHRPAQHLLSPERFPALWCLSDARRALPPGQRSLFTWQWAHCFFLFCASVWTHSIYMCDCELHSQPTGPIWCPAAEDIKHVCV